MAAQDVLRKGTTHRVTAPVVRFLSRRSLTVYLWHTTAIVVALWFVNRVADLAPGVWTFSYVVLVASLTVLATIGFGWIEDLAGRRAPRLWPLAGRLGASSGRRWAPVLVPVSVVLAMVLLLPVAPTPPPSEAAFRPRVPSQAPPRPELTEPVPVDVFETGPVTDSTVTLDANALQLVIDEWRLEYLIPGVSVAVATPGGDDFAAAVGVHDDSEPRRITDQLDVMSITKLFTANLVFRAVDAGLLELDAPLPPLVAEPDFPYADRLTVRQLLSHRTGIVNYRDSARYATDPNSVASVSDAIASSLAEPLASEPGVTPLYSSTNYLLLGRLLEQATGIDFDELLFSELLVPLGLASASHLPPDVGEPRYATAGLIADIVDLGRAGVALLRDHVGISDAAFAEMSTIDVDSGMGPGLNGFCPCSRDLDGNVRWFGVGYTGGNTLLAYVPDAQVAVAIDVTGGLYSEFGHFDAVMELSRRIAALVSLQQAPTEPI
jgi:CubicO group peptidase (beta-lactamase class C family)